MLQRSCCYCRGVVRNLGANSGIHSIRVHFKIPFLLEDPIQKRPFPYSLRFKKRQGETGRCSRGMM